MMHGVLLFILITSQISSATVLFRLRRANANSSHDASYFIGTMHVTQDLIWPYLSNEILDVIAVSDEIWLEHDFTNPEISKHIYECAVDKMTPQLQARIRAKTWPEFLNETNAEDQSPSPDSNNTTQWRQWFINKQVVSSNYFWRNRTIGKDIIFDHRIILEGYQRNKPVGSLESVPNDCFQLGTLMNKTDSSKPMDPTLQTLLSRVYNCGLVDENFIAEIYKYLDLLKMKHRNEQMVRRIRKLLQRAPHRKYLFAVGAAHLFGDISIIRMLRDQFRNEYLIEPVSAASPNFPKQFCTDDELQGLIDTISPTPNATMSKRFLNDELFKRLSASFLS